MNKSKIVKLLAVVPALVAILTGAASIQAQGAAPGLQTLLDYNYNGSPWPMASPGVPVTSASKFTIGPQDVEVASVAFVLCPGAPPSAADTTAYIFSDSAGKPSGEIGSSHQYFGAGQLPDNTFYEYCFSTPLTLSAGNTYWVAFGINPIGELPRFLTSYNLQSFVPNGITPSLSWASTAYPADSAWTLNAPNQTLAYKLQGYQVPEPNALFLLAFCLAALFRFSRH